MLEILLLSLKSDLELRPCRSLILSAGYLMEMYPRSALPDWVEVLAYPIYPRPLPNFTRWESLLDEVKIHLQAEAAALTQGGGEG